MISDALAEWALESYAKLLIDCDLLPRFHTLPVILPTRAFFTAPFGRDHATAEAVFADVKRLMGLEDRMYHLYRLPEKIEEIDNHNYQDITMVAGTFGVEGDDAIISYSSETMQVPLNFIATLAHELAHDLLPKPQTNDDLPEIEMHTDFLCIVMGFGVVQALGARQAGWAGYLSNELRMFALAIFLKLRGLPIEAALNALDGNLGKKLKRAVKQLEGMPDSYQELADVVGS